MLVLSTLVIIHQKSNKDTLLAANIEALAGYPGGEGDPVICHDIIFGDPYSNKQPIPMYLCVDFICYSIDGHFASGRKDCYIAFQN